MHGLRQFYGDDNNETEDEETQLSFEETYHEFSRIDGLLSFGETRNVVNDRTGKTETENAITFDKSIDNIQAKMRQDETQKDAPKDPQKVITKNSMKHNNTRNTAKLHPKPSDNWECGRKLSSNCKCGRTYKYYKSLLRHRKTCKYELEAKTENMDDVDIYKRSVSVINEKNKIDANIARDFIQHEKDLQACSVQKKSKTVGQYDIDIVAVQQQEPVCTIDLSAGSWRPLNERGTIDNHPSLNSGLEYFFVEEDEHRKSSYVCPQIDKSWQLCGDKESAALEFDIIRLNRHTSWIEFSTSWSPSINITNRNEAVKRKSCLLTECGLNDFQALHNVDKTV